MFYGADSFNQDISKWDVSKGENFGSMFNAADSFNQDIRNWDVSSGKSFYNMFAWNDAFNQDISVWNVTKGLGFDSMFTNADLMLQVGWSETPAASDFLGQTITGDAAAETITGAGGNDILFRFW